MATEYRVKSKHPFDEVCDKIREIVPLNGFSILSEIRTSDILRSKGFEYPNLRTFDICNAGYANRALSFDTRVETIIPCHLIVKEAENHTEVSVQLPREMFESLHREKSEEMESFLGEVETKLKAIVEELSGLKP